MAKNLILICCFSLAIGVLAWASKEQADGDPAPETKKEAAESVSPAMEARAARRSFEGAPPVIPHIVYRRDNKECLYCHSDIRETQFGTSNITPHPHLTSCQQCHVGTQILNKYLPQEEVENSFEGWVGEAKGFRTHEIAPPTVPHGMFMRENCNTCHSPDHPVMELRGSHPKRVNCRQCHVQQHAEF